MITGSGWMVYRGKMMLWLVKFQESSDLTNRLKSIGQWAISAKVGTLKAGKIWSRVERIQRGTYASRPVLQRKILIMLSIAGRDLPSGDSPH